MRRREFIGFFGDAAACRLRPHPYEFHLYYDI
jgi:hypothetical protein